MKTLARRTTALAMLAAFLWAGPASRIRADDAALEPGAEIPMPTVRGRIDHFAIDLKNQRLFIAALRNDSVEWIDLKAGRRKRSLHGFVEPQGILYLPEFDRLYVANGLGGRVDILDGASLHRLQSVEPLNDADNLRYDAAARKVYVGYARALRAFDAATGATAGDVRLAGHPEAFELEKNGTRIFVNVPDARQVAVVDRAKSAVIETWPTGDDEANFPMALDEADRRLFVATRARSMLLAYDIDTGSIVARAPVCRDADDLFFDASRRRLYVICGEGRIDVVRQADRDHYRVEGSAATALRARTGLFVPETGRIYVAAPANGDAPASVRSFRIR